MLFRSSPHLGVGGIPRGGLPICAATALLVFLVACGGTASSGVASVTSATISATTPTASASVAAGGPRPAARTTSTVAVSGSCTPLVSNGTRGPATTPSVAGQRTVTTTAVSAEVTDTTIPGTNVTADEVQAGTLPAPPRGQPVAEGTLELLTKNEPTTNGGAATSGGFEHPPLLGTPAAQWYLTSCSAEQVVAFYRAVLTGQHWTGAFATAAVPGGTPASGANAASSRVGSARATLYAGSFAIATGFGQVGAFIEVAYPVAAAPDGSTGTAVELISQRLLPRGATNGPTSGNTSTTTETSGAVGGAAAPSQGASTESATTSAAAPRVTASRASTSSSMVSSSAALPLPAQPTPPAVGPGASSSARTISSTAPAEMPTAVSTLP